MKRLVFAVAVTLAVLGVGATSAHGADSQPTVSADDGGDGTKTTAALLPLDESDGPTGTPAVDEHATPGEPKVSGPSVSVKPSVVNPGERSWITISGFQSRIVTISVCGNEARRGSGDCNMEQSQGMGLTPGTTAAINLIISEPPTKCPCVIRVRSQGSDEIGVAPITITGHPVGPIIDPPSFGDLVRVDVHATESPRSFWGYLRPELGGKTPYDVTVSVKNLTTSTLHNLKVFGAVGRTDTDYLADVRFGVPGDLPPGQTWSQTVRAVVKAPAVGTLRWRAAVSGAGNTVTGYDSVTHKPLLLTGMSLLAVASLFSLILRFMIRRHMRKADGESAGVAVTETVIDVTARPVDAEVIEADDLVGVG